MKKIICLVVALIMALSMSSFVFAENEGIINNNEKRVLDVLKTIVTVNNVKVKLEDVNIKKAENYFKTIDLTEEQADKIIGFLNKGIELIKENKVKSVWQLSQSKRLELLGYGNQATNVCGMTLTYNRTREIFDIRDNETTELVYEQEKVLKITGDTTPLYYYAAAAVVLIVLAGVVIVKKRKAMAK